MRTFFSFMITAAAAIAVPGLSTESALAAPSTAAPAELARFRTFFATFRKAVLANDRNAVAGMTRFPFRDFREGHYCEPGRKDCTVSPETAASRTRAEFLARYDRIFTPAVVAAIRAGHVRGFKSGDDDGEVGGPIGKGEYLIEAENVGDQRVFVPVGGTWKLDRIPFYS